MSNSRIRGLVMGGLLAAMTFVATFWGRVPIPGTHGYVNLGDGVLMMAGLLFGPWVGFAAGAIGSAIADMWAGYALYAPVTFIVKGLEGFAVGAIAHKSFLKKPLGIKTILGLLLGCVVMVGGYFTAEVFMFDVATASAAVIANCGQAAAGFVVAITSATALRRSGIVK